MTAIDTFDFEAAFRERVTDVTEACVSCGKCVEVCPITKEAGIGDQPPKAIADGVLDILRTGTGSQAAEKWARSCILSGECIAACEYGVNPRLMLSMARMSLSEHVSDDHARRGAGINAFRELSKGVKVLSRLQLSEEELQRLGQGPQPIEVDETDPPDYVLYTGCNVLKTPHIALLCLDIMDRLGISYRVLGGPSHCCGVMHYRAGDLVDANRMAAATIERFVSTGTSQVLAWCPSCHVQFSEVGLPTYERATGTKPIEMIPFMPFLESRLDELKPHLTRPVNQRIALHLHRGVEGVAEAARRLLAAVPGVELVDLHQSEIGLMSNYLRPLPKMHAKLHLEELSAAEEAGIDALAAIYHADHRELCAHERDWPFAIVNILEVIGASMGLSRDDHFKRLKLKQDAEVILADCAEIIDRHGFDREVARPVIEKALLGEQPLPLRGNATDDAAGGL
jgi:heterodisulfide reductase subunit D